MLKMTIDNEEVVSKNNFTIKEEMLSPSSTILNNTYPKTWEDDKNYTSRFYYPKDYAKLDIQNFSITPEEAGTTIDIVGSATLTDVDTTKESRVLALKGQTSQTGTPTPTSPIPVNVVSGDNYINICGKNLFDKDNSQIGKAWNNASASNRAIVITKVEPNTTYNISYQDKSGVDGIYFFGRTNENDSTTSIGTTGITSSPRQVITTANTNYLGIQFNKENVSQSDIDNVGIQIEKGSTATTYEPYVGNSYPISLKGNNLYKGTLYNGIINQGGTYISNANRITNAGSSTMKTFILKKGTYTLSIENIDACTIVIKNESGSVIQEFADSWKTLPYTFTTTNDGYFYFSAKKNNDSALTPSDYKPMLNKGTTALPYEDNWEIELCKIGTYQDYIYKENGSWYLHKEIGKVVLDGTINWTLNQQATYVNQYLMSGTNLSEDVASGTANIMSDYFKYKQGNPTNTTNEDYMWLYQKKLVLDVRKTIVSDATGLKTWVGNNKPTIYYQLATPTTTLITDTTLLEQLDNLESQ